MEAKPSLKTEEAWKKLEDYYNNTGKNLKLNELFELSCGRFKKFR